MTGIISCRVWQDRVSRRLKGVGIDECIAGKSGFIKAINQQRGLDASYRDYKGRLLDSASLLG